MAKNKNTQNETIVLKKAFAVKKNKTKHEETCPSKGFAAKKQTHKMQPAGTIPGMRFAANNENTKKQDEIVSVQEMRCEEEKEYTNRRDCSREETRRAD